MEKPQHPDPTKISPVVEQQIELNRQLTRAMPSASREEIAEVQAELQPAPEGTTVAAVEPEPATTDDLPEQVA